MGTDSQRVLERREDEGEQSREEAAAHRQKEDDDQQSTHAIDGRQDAIGRVQRSPSGATDTSTADRRESASLGDGSVAYDPGPDRATLSERYGMAVHGGEATKLQRLEDEFGEPRVQRWADEGMTVGTMGRTRDMEAFRRRQDERPDEVPSDIERQNEASAQRSADAARDDGPAGDAGAPDAVREVVSSPGRSMDDSVQREMESKMGGSFADVQLHTGPKAAEAADSINARAFTVGNHVAFNSGEYNPDSDSGKKVLAHELTHVRQQTDGRVSMLPKAGVEHPGIDPAEGGVVQRRGHELVVQPKLEVSSPNDPAEKEAERVAEAVMKMDDSERADTGGEKTPNVQQRGVGRVIQREAASESGDASNTAENDNRKDPGSLSWSNKLKEFIKTHEGIPKVNDGQHEDQIPDDYPSNSAIGEPNQPIPYENDVVPYNDPRGLATIGWGHLIDQAGESCDTLREQGTPEMREYDTGVTESKARDILHGDLDENGGYVAHFIDAQLYQHEYDALLSFSFNAGCGSMNSHLSAVVEDPNSTPHDVAQQIMAWPRIPDRRSDEAEMFVNDRYERHTTYSGPADEGDASRGDDDEQAELEEQTEEVEVDEEAESGDGGESSTDEAEPMGYIETSLEQDEVDYPGQLAAAWDISFDELSEFNAAQDNSWDGDAYSLGADQEVRVPLGGTVVEEDTAGIESETEPEAEVEEEIEAEVEEQVEEQAEDSGLLGGLRDAVEQGTKMLGGLFGGSENEAEDALEEQDGDSGLFGGLTDAVAEGVESVTETVGKGTSWASEQLESLFGEDEVEEQAVNEMQEQDADPMWWSPFPLFGQYQEQDEAEEEDISDEIARVIERETEAYQELKVDLHPADEEIEDIVEVEPTYFNWGTRGPSDDYGDHERTGGFNRLVDNFSERAEEQFRGTGGGDMGKGHAVKVGKASPGVLEDLIEEAIKEGEVQQFGGLDQDEWPDNTDDPESVIQDWIDTRGVGVDCSGFVAHMLTEIRRERVGDEDFDEDDLPEGARRRDNALAVEEGEVRVKNRGAADFNLHEGDNAMYVEEEVADEYKRDNIDELQPGDVGVSENLGHVIMVAEVTYDDGEYEVTTVESSSSGTLAEQGITEETETVDNLADLRENYSWYGVAAIDF